MKNLRIIALYAMCSIAILSSCKKDKDNAPAPASAPAPAPAAATKTSLLTGKNWKKISMTSNGFETISSTDPACQNDNITSFAAKSSTTTDGTFFYDQKVKCDPAEENFTRNWKFNANQTSIISILYTSDGFTEGEATILELTSSTLKTQRIMTINGTAYTIIETYKAQ